MGEDSLRVRSRLPCWSCVFNNVAEIQDLVLSLGQPVSISTSEMFSASAASISNPVSPIFKFVLAPRWFPLKHTDGSVITAFRMQ